MPSLLEQYRISDFLEWNEKKSLKLNPDFQRGSVWKPAARSFLIDTILRKLPIPKVYLRTLIDVSTKKAIREVVDGQQRLRAILDFADDKFVLTKRSEEFAGKKYSTLSEDEQETFLSYAIAVDQLVNATTDDVLEVFARLNSYTVVLNGPEKRHAKFQGDFKWAVRELSRKHSKFWEDYGVFTVQQRVRMLDDSLVAEMLGVLLEGVKDGGQPKIDVIYVKYEKKFDAAILASFEFVLEFIIRKLADTLKGTPLLNPPHLLMLFASVAAVTVGIPQGEITAPDMSSLAKKTAKLDVVRDNVLFLASLIADDAEPTGYFNFWRSSRGSTQRIASRQERLPIYIKALQSDAM